MRQSRSLQGSQPNFLPVMEEREGEIMEKPTMVYSNIDEVMVIEFKEEHSSFENPPTPVIFQ